jgi:hypothetical protein
LAAGDVNSAATAAGVAATAPEGFAAIVPTLGLAGFSPAWGDAYRIGQGMRHTALTFLQNISSNPLVMGLLVLAGVAGFGVAFDKRGRR